MPRSRLAHVLLGLAAALAASGAGAQGTAGSTATATATVISPIALAVTNQMQFGKLARNSTKSQTTNGNGNANGRFYVSGQGAHGIGVTLTFPAVLTKGSDQLAIGDWTGTSDTFDWNNMTPYTPASGVAAARTLPGTSAQTDQRLYFRLGARITAAALQPLGIYTGTVTITAAYTGI